MSCRYRPVAPQEQIKIVHMTDLVRQAIDQQERIRALPVRLKKTLPDELSTKDFRGEPQTIVSITLTHRGAAGEFTAPRRVPQRWESERFVGMSGDCRFVDVDAEDRTLRNHNRSAIQRIPSPDQIAAPINAQKAAIGDGGPGSPPTIPSRRNAER